MRVVLGVVMVGACGFAPHAGAPPGPGDGGPIDAPDARMVDGNDAMAANARRKSITTVAGMVSGTLIDFPVWIDLTDTDIAARAQTDGHDIYFTAADGTTRLDHQLRWDAGAHRLNAWVRVPTLKAATVIYVNYGDAGAAPNQNPPGVFKSSFAAVWHLDDALPAATIAEATGTHAGTPALTTTTTTTGQLGGGLAFADSGDEITFINPLTGQTEHTISMWVKQPSVNHVSSMIVVGTGTTSHARWFYSHYTAATMACGFYANDWTANNNIDTDTWTLLHWVYEGANGKNHLYKNGAEINGSPQTLNGVNTTGTTGMIGHAPEPGFGNNMGLEGSIDEVRIATTNRNAGWISTEYANQSSPGTFYTVGTEELVP